MDWTKAKTIVIVALLMTNIVFVGSYLFGFGQPDVIEDVEKNTVDLLAQKNIYLETEIPEQSRKMAVLSVKYNKLKYDIETEVMKQQTPLLKNNPNKEDYVSISKEFIKTCGVYNETVEFQSFETKEGKSYVQFKNVYKGIPIEESYMNCIIEDGKVVDFQRKWFDPVAFGDTKKKVVSATTALVKFMTKKEQEKENSQLEPEAIYIEDISLVYWLYSYTFDGEVSTSEDTAFPAWKITYNNGEKDYILAYQQ